MRVLALVLALVLPRAARALAHDLNPAAWMNATRDRALGELTLPGSHDSATQYLSPKLQPGRAGQLPRWLDDAVKLAESIGVPADELVRRWARAQSTRVGEQLRMGARYVDLRSGWDGDQGVWRAHHALEGQAVNEILEEIKVFLVEQPSEVVIVELSHFYGDPSESEVALLATSTTEIFGRLLAPYPGDARAALYEMKLGKDYVDVNHRAIVVFENADVGKKFKLWPRSTLTNTYADSDDARAMASFNRDVVAAFNEKSFRDDALLKLSWTLTPQASTIVRSLNIFEKNPKSLLALASTRANPPLRDFADDAARDACSLAHIIVVDDFDHSTVVDVALASNVRGMYPKGACAWSSPARAVAR
jgi:hypothetical protein